MKAKKQKSNDFQLTMQSLIWEWRKHLSIGNLQNQIHEIVWRGTKQTSNWILHWDQEKTWCWSRKEGGRVGGVDVDRDSEKETPQGWCYLDVVASPYGLANITVLSWLIFVIGIGLPEAYR